MARTSGLFHVRHITGVTPSRQKPSRRFAVDGFRCLRVLYWCIGIVLFNGRGRFSSLVLVEGVLVDLMHYQLKTLAVGIHEAVVNQIAVVIEGERAAVSDFSLQTAISLLSG
ncbi:hypothetical protein MUA04_01775 [Enterobacteriaceae bacterium H11S18]|uniref:hypothetical protein n=1 Tax=Dryocola clanedunensis TaxID=2925396 RepID=UPI0022F0E1E0|nr:hypothetical protein [Dryocola clanedunensis]MCT4708947.1 hypothetical protein [Dryocola clanedunensis]